MKDWRNKAAFWLATKVLVLLADREYRALCEGLWVTGIIAAGDHRSMDRYLLALHEADGDIMKASEIIGSYE